MELNNFIKLGEYTRVLKLARKPNKDEFTMIAKVAGAGILLIGLIGFIIFMVLSEMPRGIL
ncbi:MAG: protein translocase SEC61 complex subunit gamma [Euryarchaeota archaeon]|uniref:Protein translocase subunit SecE n=1 Tax=Candidatus Methanogaster sp. ANME-2c ERB4 TaxID=2759911 RepID=A0A7G9YQ79_9EURY|nr:MAG: Protein translocase subunit SecE [ANME-2 cluster archaeon]MEA1864539.1 protein translocase SEC61 complex subunit gamma [Euryarchaeota archaeon]QNO50163.1 protein translocase subunit SecE [Methanosarcinales archaeon ANME-2c ERB4]QNO50211.1 protein translocase subunit SecE [Methanosarcinales archaeon ANME-2c ERB4]